MNGQLNSASSQMLDAVALSKQEAQRAEREFDRVATYVQSMASSKIDIVDDEAKGRVRAIVREADAACETLYTSYQSLVRVLDETCRPLLAQSPDACAIQEVANQIKWLNEESAIENNYSASFQGLEIGDIAQVQYRASMESQMIQHYWEAQYASTPTAKKLDQIHAEADDRRKSADQIALESFEKKKAEAKDSREKEKVNLAAKLQEEFGTAIRKTKKDCAAKCAELTACIQELTRSKNALEQELNSLGLFDFKKKSNLKKQIDVLTSQITDAANKRVAVQKKADTDCKNIKEVWDREQSEGNRRIDDAFPIPKQPEGMSVSGYNAWLSAQVLDWMEAGERYTISQILENCPAADGVGNSKLSVLMRHLLRDGEISQEEEGRRTFYMK